MGSSPKGIHLFYILVFGDLLITCILVLFKVLILPKNRRQLPSLVRICLNDENFAFSSRCPYNLSDIVTPRDGHSPRWRLRPIP